MKGKRLWSIFVMLAMLLAAVPAMPASAAASIQIGQYLEMGTYYGEPILWRCVDIDENGPLMLSDKIICLKPFDAKGTNTSGSHGRGYNGGYYRQNEYGSNYWGDSNMRCWLNSSASAGNVVWSCGNPPDNNHVEYGHNDYADEQGFKRNFTSGELAAVRTVTQDSLLNYNEYSDMSPYGSDYHSRNHNINNVVQNAKTTAYREQVTDDFFLLDVNQINAVYNNRGVLGDDYYIGEPTAQAVANSEFKIRKTGNKCSSWLRSPNAGNDNSEFVRLLCRVDGVYGTYENYAYVGSNGVRPAFYLNLSSSSFTSGNGTENAPYRVVGNGVNAEAPTPEPTQLPLMGLPEILEIEIDAPSAYKACFNRNNVSLTVADTSIAEAEDFGFIQVEDYNGYAEEGSIFLIIPKAPGETTLTATAPDGGILKSKLIVKGVIADNITDEIVLRAKVLSNNNSYQYYKNVFSSPSKLTNDSFKENGMENLASDYLIVNELLKFLTFKLPSGKKLDDVKYYETILADILENSTSSDNGANVWDNTYSAWNKIYKGYNNDIVQKIAGKVTDLDGVKTSKFFKDHTDKKVFAEIMDYSKEEGGKLKEIKIEADILDKISLSADLVNDFFDAVDEMLAYSAVQQEKIDVLKSLKESTANEWLAEACDNVIEDIEFAHRSTVAYFASEFGKGAVKDILEFSHGCVMGVVLEYFTTDSHGLTPYLPGLKEATAILKGAQAVSNIVINADGISEKVLAISAYASVENQLKWITNLAESSFKRDPNVETAISFMAHADMLKATLLTSCDIFEDYAKEIETGNKRIKAAETVLDLYTLNFDDLSKLIKTGFKDQGIEDSIKSCKAIKRYIEEADFYAPYGDIAAYISVERSSTPSSWAKEYVDRAIKYKVLPEYLQNNYQNNITRAEFCTLLTNLIVEKTGKWIEDLPNYNKSNKLFKDTYYKNVYYMYGLGIVNGVSEDDFNPLGYITREQAATMLKRTAEVLNINSAAPNTNLDGVSDWAKDGVNFVADRGIMTGTDRGFEPQGTYTKEQAITTFVRFYENLN